jgi:hypothetical protein
VATNFPASLDSLTNPTSSDSLNSPSHSAQHANVNDAVEALQAKVGADSSAVTTSLDYKVAQLEAVSHGKILQVVSTTKTDAFSASVTLGNFTAITGLSASITPSSSSSKILVVVQATIGSSSQVAALRLRRDGTDIFQSDASADIESTTGRFGTDGTSNQVQVTLVFQDSPASTSSLTYDCSISADTSATVYLNRAHITGNSYNFRGASTITVMEVSA